MSSSNGKKSGSKQQEQYLKPVPIPPGAKPTTLSWNRGGYIDPQTGVEMNAFGEPALKPIDFNPDGSPRAWTGTRSIQYINQALRNAGMIQDSVPSRTGSMPPPSKGGSPVGGQAGQVGNTGVTGDMQSQSGVMPSSMGLSQGPPQPPMPMPSAKVMVPVEQTVNRNSTDVGQVFMPPIPVPSGAPVQPVYVDPRADFITKMRGLGLPEVQRPVTTMPAQRPIQAIPIPVITQQPEPQPWWREYLGYIGL